MIRTVVTGGAGFIGHHLCAALARSGAHPYAIDDLSSGRAELLEELDTPVELFQLDVRDRDALTALLRELEPDWVLHLAGLHYIPACNNDPVATLAINTLGTASLLEAIRATVDVSGIVLASTAAVYPPDSTICRESDAPGPDDIYGQSKLFAEALVHRFSRETGIPAVVARLFNVYGPGETNPHVIPEILQQARTSDVIHLGNLETRRDYVYVDDVVAALVRLVNNGPVSPQILNIGTGCVRSVEELVATLGNVLQRPLRAVSDPARVRRVDRATLCADITLARATLDWTPRVPLEEGLNATWNSVQP